MMSSRTKSVTTKLMEVGLAEASMLVGIQDTDVGADTARIY
jgi:hypothetical protein